MSEMTGRKTFKTAIDGARADARLRLLAVSAVTPTLLHELMQPLGSALNHLAVASRQAARECGAAAAGEAIARSESAVARAAGIVRRMRDFVLDGQVRSDRIDLLGAVRKVRSRLPARQMCALHVTYALGEDADHVCADELLIELVLRNLLVNAIEADPAGGAATVAISSSRFRDMVIVTVADSGPGLSDEAYAKLFEPMFTTKPEGSGLGLALSRIIVEAHGGQLWAAEPGTGGATFYLTLPISRADTKGAALDA